MSRNAEFPDVLCDTVAGIWMTGTHLIYIFNSSGIVHHETHMVIAFVTSKDLQGKQSCFEFQCIYTDSNFSTIPVTTSSTMLTGTSPTSKRCVRKEDKIWFPITNITIKLWEDKILSFHHCSSILASSDNSSGKLWSPQYVHNTYNLKTDRVLSREQAI